MWIESSMGAQLVWKWRLDLTFFSVLQLTLFLLVSLTRGLVFGVDNQMARINAWLAIKDFESRANKCNFWSSSAIWWEKNFGGRYWGFKKSIWALLSVWKITNCFAMGRMTSYKLYFNKNLELKNFFWVNLLLNIWELVVCFENCWLQIFY